MSARRIAAQKAASELDHFRALPNVDDGQILAAKEIFNHWERTADRRLDELATQSEIERKVLYRRQSLALSRITARELLQTLVTTGVISSAVADEAGARIMVDLSDG